MVGIAAALDIGAFRGSHLLVIGDTGVHLLMSSGILFRHWSFAMTVFGSELFMFMLGWQSSLLLNRLDSVLMMVNFVLLDCFLVDFLSLSWSHGLMCSLGLDIRLDGGVVVFSRGKNLKSETGILGTHIFDFVHV